MTFARRIAAVVVALIVAAVAGVAVAAPAYAEAPPDSCAAESVCGYVNTGYRTNQGYEYVVYRPDRGVCVVVGLRNAWSGVFNNSGHTIRLFRNTGCTGTDYKQFTNGTGHHQLSVKFPFQGWDNTIDAVQFR